MKALLSSTGRGGFFVTCAPGLEPLLHAEMKALKLAKTERQVGGVRFEGTLTDAWRANLWLRTAVRVLMELTRFGARDEAELYAGASQVAWELLASPEGSVLVDAHTSRSALDHTQFIERRVKDAVCDRFRERSGARPSVDKDDPDLRIHAHLYQDRCRLLADTSGASLHKRGWRKFQGRAPLAETLAAACLLHSGWDRRAPLLDPFAGSGTLLIEGALLAANAAPGLSRHSFGFERWPGHDAAGWRSMREQARAEVSPPRKLTIWGGERSREAVEGARVNLEAAGLAGRIEIVLADGREFAPRPGWNGWVVSNLPYGERVGQRDEVEELLRDFGIQLREHCAGYHFALLTGGGRAAETLGLARAQRVKILNGGLECELLLA